MFAVSGSSFFKGKRYMLHGDMATMLLFDSHGQIAGMQMGVRNVILIIVSVFTHLIIVLKLFFNFVMILVPK